MLVAGARDALLSVWPITSPSNKSKSANPLPSTPCHFLYGHDAPITALATSSGLRTAVSAATNGTLLLHHVPTGKLLRVFPKLPRPVSLVAISDVTPAVVSYCPSLRRLHCFHIQVRHACLSCMVFSEPLYFISTDTATATPTLYSAECNRPEKVTVRRCVRSSAVLSKWLVNFDQARLQFIEWSPWYEQLNACTRALYFSQLRRFLNRKKNETTYNKTGHELHDYTGRGDCNTGAWGNGVMHACVTMWAHAVGGWGAHRGGRGACCGHAQGCCTPAIVVTQPPGAISHHTFILCISFSRTRPMFQTIYRISNKSIRILSGSEFPKHL